MTMTETKNIYPYIDRFGIRESLLHGGVVEKSFLIDQEVHGWYLSSKDKIFLKKEEITNEFSKIFCAWKEAVVGWAWNILS